MRQKKLSFIAAAVVILSFILVFEAEAQWRGGRRGKGMGQGFSLNCLERINLTQEQTAKINSLRSEYFKDTVSPKSDIYKKRLELKSLLLEKDVNVEKAIKTQDEMFDLKKKLAKKRLQAEIEAKKILTPEQIAQLPPGCNFGFGKTDGGRGRGMGGGGGPGFGRNMW